MTLLRQTFSNIVCYDPLAQMNDAETFIRAESVRDAISGAHVVAILTEWPEFSQVKPEEFAQLMTGNTIIDARYILDSDEFRSFGLVVRSLGKASSN